MNSKPVLVYGFELCTRKITEEGVDLARYDHETVEFHLNQILKLSTKERVLLKDNKMINLVSLDNSYDQEYLLGVFVTARYGKEQDIINVFEQNMIGKKGKNEGATNNVQFMIHKKTGLLLVEKDSENVARGNFIQTYLNKHRKLFSCYSDSFNIMFKPNKVYKSGFIKLVSLPSKSFFDEIAEFATIKEAFVYKDIPKTGLNNETSTFLFLAQQAQEEGVEDVSRVKMSFENKIRKSSIKHIKTFFEKLFEAGHYDGLGVSGKLHSGRARTIELENIQRAFDLNIEHHDSGLPILDDLLSKMIMIGKVDNPLHEKGNIEQFEGVVIDVKVQGAER